MGLTPTGGIPMGTRSGDLDPGIILYLLRNEKLDADGLEALLNHQSGLFALSSGESDVKALEERASSWRHNCWSCPGHLRGFGKKSNRSIHRAAGWD